MPNKRKELPNSTTCFVCGEKNHAGLQTRFYIEDDAVKAKLTPRDWHCGYANVVHGGVVAAIVDECMGWAAARSIGRMCYTAELSVRYVKPVPVDRDTVAIARTKRHSKRIAFVEGRLVDDDGSEYVRCEGKFMPLSAEETLAVDDALLYRGGEERMFDSLRRNPGE
ncbi:MAG TPA: PaaI family thioesterase [Candidatus Hydrogenedentes bacterium]|nr:PaaI family thioesterase [Candidatus Hydrogenedentota bacterium]HOS01816.1 PaaI family thioesterase [Candidatus Hydrogenedentota bacterium]